MAFRKRENFRYSPQHSLARWLTTSEQLRLIQTIIPLYARHIYFWHIFDHTWLECFMMCGGDFLSAKKKKRKKSSIRFQHTHTWPSEFELWAFSFRFFFFLLVVLLSGGKVSISPFSAPTSCFLFSPMEKDFFFPFRFPSGPRAAVWVWESGSLWMCALIMDLFRSPLMLRNIQFLSFIFFLYSSVGNAIAKNICGTKSPMVSAGGSRQRFHAEVAAKAAKGREKSFPSSV